VGVAGAPSISPGNVDSQIPLVSTSSLLVYINGIDFFAGLLMADSLENPRCGGILSLFPPCQTLLRFFVPRIDPREVCATSTFSYLAESRQDPSRTRPFFGSLSCSGPDPSRNAELFSLSFLDHHRVLRRGPSTSPPALSWTGGEGPFSALFEMLGKL